MDYLEKQIYEWMSDEQSKDIYQKRIAFRDSFDYSYMQSIVDLYVPECKGQKWVALSDELRDHLKDYARIVVFGCGQRGKALMHMLLQEGFPLVAGMDNGFEGEFDDIPIVANCDLTAEHLCVLISPVDGGAVNSMKQQLLRQDVSENDIFVLNEYTDSGRILEDKQYFDSLLDYTEDEVFVDCGAYDLETSKRFIDECVKNGGHCSKIIAFEADEKSFDVSLNAKEELQKKWDGEVELFRKGVWDSDRELFLSGNGGGNSVVNADGTGVSISVCAMDHVINEKVTFIKMDIEGAELNALHGAEEVIKKYRPKLAISVYHKPEDLTEIPAYIKQIVPEYQLYMRHYSSHTGETVLYAI